VPLLWRIFVLVAAVKKVISVTHYQCASVALVIQHAKRVSVALVIQHAKRMRRILLSSVPCLALPYFLTLPHGRRDLR